MYKLLTEEEREKVAREYALRRLVILNSGIIFVLLVGIAGLLPSYLISHARLIEANARSKAGISIQDEREKEELMAWLSTTNKRLSLISPELDQDRSLEYVEEFLSGNFDGITVSDITWAKAEEGFSLKISGLALDRQKLITFEEYINSTGYFAKTSVPVSQLAREKNLEFDLTLTPPKQP